MIYARPPYRRCCTISCSTGGIAAEQIILEITERGFVDPETTMPVIAHYRQAGHRISIDDFGTGYSSLSYLQKLDVDTLKIDKSLSIPSSTGR